MSACAIPWHHLQPGSHRLPCPACDRGKKDDALGLTIDSSGAVWHCFRCGDSGSERRPERPLPNAGHSPHATSGQVTPASASLASNWSAYFDRLPPLAGTLGERYLRSRKCVVPPIDSALRFDRAAWHWPSQSYHPAIVALLTDFQDAGIRRSLHFTFLAPDGSGKASVSRPKLLLAKHSKSGAVIRLWPDEDVTDGLALAEGIESALSAAHIFLPIWATGDAGNMAGLVVLEGIRELTVFADHDKAGLDAAHELACRWRNARRGVTVLRSRVAGLDANDLLQAAA